MQVSAFVRKMIKTNRIYQLKINCHPELVEGWACLPSGKTVKVHHSKLRNCM